MSSCRGSLQECLQALVAFLSVSTLVRLSPSAFANNGVNGVLAEDIRRWAYSVSLPIQSLELAPLFDRLP